MKKGDKVILDSHFGYELGYYLKEGNLYHTYLIDIITGLIKAPVSYPIAQVFPYTEEFHTELKKKYHSNKNF